MDQSTIQQLNQLNQKFYQDIAEDFADSRQYYWQGWSQLLPEIKKLTEADDGVKKEIKVLDLGCGNGRFAQFLNKHQINFSYVGVDNNQKLLKLARNNLKELEVNFKIQSIDLVSVLLERGLEHHFKEKFDFIVVFGVIHHIPDLQLRKKLFLSLARLLTKGGVAVVTAWQFANRARFKEKIIAPQKVGLNQNQLEENDFILDWKRGKTSYRYCHYLTLKEAKTFLQELPSFKLKKHFLADGKSNDLNLYLVLSPS
ncbi:MAG: class I SAM-dependent methyltransferase [Patescibacteria group bacterium]|nr:class I SAM-dependent methyltransferase [Patescibacteria group bacterium]